MLPSKESRDLPDTHSALARHLLRLVAALAHTARAIREAVASGKRDTDQSFAGRSSCLVLIEALDLVGTAAARE